jgi:hypothetical protein
MSLLALLEFLQESELPNNALIWSLLLVIVPGCDKKINISLAEAQQIQKIKYQQNLFFLSLNLSLMPSILN